MAEDRLSFLEEPVQDEAPETEAPATSVEPPAEPAPQRDEQGRFAPKDGKGEEGAPPAPEPRDRHIPVTALLDERDKRQAAERDRERYQRELEDLRRQMQPKALIETPDVISDPEGFQAHLMRQQAMVLNNQEAAFSERFARKEYGDEAVNAALEAAKASGSVQQFYSGPDRWERMVLWHKQQQVIQEVGSDPTAYRTRLETELRAQIESEVRAKMLAEVQPHRPPLPPTSLASAPSAGDVAAQGDTEAFSNAFRRPKKG